VVAGDFGSCIALDGPDNVDWGGLTGLNATDGGAWTHVYSNLY
jgi:hypothetical protein